MSDNNIQKFRRGKRSTLNQDPIGFSTGQPRFTTDTNELFVYTGDENILIGSRNNIKYKGDYNSVAIYDKFDLVIEEGVLYLSLTNNNINSIPGDSEEWKLFVKEVDETKIEEIIDERVADTIVNVKYNQVTNKLDFYKYEEDSIISIDFKVESLIKGMEIDENNNLVLEFDDGTFDVVDLGLLISDLEERINAKLEGKVDKVEGKQLSTHDFDDTYKEKVDLISKEGSGSKYLADDGTYKTIKRYAGVNLSEPSGSFIRVAEISRSSTEAHSVLFIVNGENNLNEGHDNWFGILEWNIPILGRTPSLRWLAVNDPGFNPKDFKLMTRTKTNNLAIWVKPTSNKINMYVIEEYTNGVPSQKTELYNVTNPTSGIISQYESKSEIFSLIGKLAGTVPSYTTIANLPLDGNITKEALTEALELAVATDLKDGLMSSDDKRILDFLWDTFEEGDLSLLEDLQRILNDLNESENTDIIQSLADKVSSSIEINGHNLGANINLTLDDILGEGALERWNNLITTTELENILGANFERNAQVNVQSDWNETDTDSDKYIKNKPDLKTNNIETFDDIIPNMDVGGLKAGVKIDKDRDIHSILKELLVKLFYPTYEEPSLSTTLTPSTTSFEVGSKQNIHINATYRRGEIKGNMVNGAWNPEETQGNRAGLVNSEVYKFNGNIGSNHIFENITIEEGNNTFEAIFSHDIGDQPKDSEGNDYDLPLQPGNVSSTKIIRGFRNIFYGTKSGSYDVTNSNGVRGLGKTKEAIANNFTFDALDGIKTIAIAYPMSLGELADIRQVSGVNERIIDNFVRTEVDVEGANGYTAIGYYVYKYTLPKALEGDWIVEVKFNG